ncbi:hypothetical protein PLESTF_000620200 [Pleodorina starrii]|nr:hypothetical protein PLESTM_001001900 [Pleodorina starrii]GLC67894.1 hypothetical protein PLESTF_000620200 [Pleodorina starrii]
MHCIRAVIGPPGMVGMRMALSLSMPVVGAIHTRAASCPAAKLPWAVRFFQHHASVASQRSIGLQIFRQHFTASFRPTEMQHNAKPWGFSPGSAIGLAAAIGSIGHLCGGDTPGGTATALAAAMLLNLSILVHEAGHLAAARAMGVAVREFSVGIGPWVAWWQTPTTTYCLRAIPLLGFVSFLTAGQRAAAQAAAAAAAEAGGGGAAAAAGAYGSMYSSHSASATARAHAPTRLLESLSPGRRAVVMAAGVAANVALAAAFVAWQVLSYGEIGTVVQPGARIHHADGWMGDEEVVPQGGTTVQQQQQQDGRGGAATAVGRSSSSSSSSSSLRLRAGDVVLSVGQQRLPAGGAADQAFVSALRAAAAAGPEPPASGAGGPEDEHLAQQGAVQSLEGVKMAVLRTCTDGGSAAPSRTVLQLDAADVLKYETLQVTPNIRVGYRRPEDWGEAVQMTGRELRSWAERVVDCWAELLTSVSGGGGGGGVSSVSSGDGGDGAGAQFVGPLGLLAAVAEYAAVADSSRLRPNHQDTVAMSNSNSSSNSSSSSGSCGSCGSSGSGSSSSSSSSSSRGGGGDAGQLDFDATQALLDESVVQEPHPLMGLGVQLNLQLALFNLLPLPVLDGGQLVLVAMEALRGGRRLVPSLERTALLGSVLLLGGWLVALSVRDVVALADRAAVRLAAVVEPHYGKYGTSYGRVRDGGGGDDDDEQRFSNEDGGSVAAAAVVTASLAL